MKQFDHVVFDEIIMGAKPMYTDPAINELLGSPDAMAVQVVSSLLSGAGSLTVVLEHSPDGKTWTPRSPAPELDRVLLDSSDTENRVIFQDQSIPMGELLRLRFEVGGGVVRVKAMACGRSSGVMVDDKPCCDACKTAASPRKTSCGCSAPGEAGDDAQSPDASSAPINALVERKAGAPVVRSKEEPASGGSARAGYISQLLNSQGGLRKNLAELQGIPGYTELPKALDGNCAMTADCEGVISQKYCNYNNCLLYGKRDCDAELTYGLWTVCCLGGYDFCNKGVDPCGSTFCTFLIKSCDMQPDLFSVHAAKLAYDWCKSGNPIVPKPKDGPPNASTDDGITCEEWAKSNYDIEKQGCYSGAPALFDLCMLLASQDYQEALASCASGVDETKCKKASSTWGDAAGCWGKKGKDCWECCIDKLAADGSRRLDCCNYCCNTTDTRCQGCPKGDGECSTYFWKSDCKDCCARNEDPNTDARDDCCRKCCNLEGKALINCITAPKQ